MPYVEPYEMDMDRSTSRMEVVRMHPTRHFTKVDLDPVTGKWLGSPALYKWQNGTWYDTGDREIDPSEVPEKFRKEIEDHPVQMTFGKTPAVTAACRICGDKMNSSEMEAHLIEHVNNTMKTAGQISDTVPPPVGKGERPVTAKNTHVPGA